MTETIKDSIDDVQVLPLPQLGASSSLILAPPPPYSMDVDQEGSNMNESRELYSANPQSITIPHPSALTVESRSEPIPRTCLPKSPSDRSHLHNMRFCSHPSLPRPTCEGKKATALLNGLTWAGITPSERCLRFGAREYSAQLMDITQGEDGMRWCKKKRIIIHGFDIGRPGYCTVDMDRLGATNLRIFEHWTVNFNESSCKTLWENFQDKGCVATGSKTPRAYVYTSNIRTVCSDFLGSVSELIWVSINRHGIIGERCAQLTPPTMMGIISISPPVARTTGYAASALCGPPL